LTINCDGEVDDVESHGLSTRYTDHAERRVGLRVEGAHKADFPDCCGGQDCNQRDHY
jgi:hypothetical protein